MLSEATSGNNGVICRVRSFSTGPFAKSDLHADADFVPVAGREIVQFELEILIVVCLD